MQEIEKATGRQDPSPITDRTITRPIPSTFDDAHAIPSDGTAAEHSAELTTGAERDAGLPVEADETTNHLPDAVDTDGMVDTQAEGESPTSSEDSCTEEEQEATETTTETPLSSFLAHLQANDLDSCAAKAVEIAEEGLPAAKKAVLTVFTADMLKTHQRRWAAQELIAAHAGKAHRFYRDGDQAYVAWDGQIIPLHDERDRLYAALRRDYGLPRAASVLKGIGDHLYQYALDHGEQVSTLTLARFDAATNTSYFHSQGTEVLRIGAGGVEVVQNGIDGKLFLPDPSGNAFRVPLRGGPPSGDPFMEHILGAARFGGGVLTHEQSVLLLKAWRLASLLTAEGQPRPILALIGSRGSGKSTLASRLGKVVIGPQFTVSLNHGGERDERIALCRKAFMVLDNLERISKRTEDNLCTAVSGGSVGLRVQRTTDRYIDVPIRPWIVTTNQAMPTGRSDLLERCIFLPMERLSSYSSSMQDVTAPDIRRSVLQQMVWEAQQLVLRRANGSWIEYEGGYRMADFAAIVLNLAEAYGVPELGREAIENLVNEVETEQTLERPTIELIDFWLRKKGAEVLDREFTTRELGIELAGVQSEAGVAFPEKGRPDKLGQFLTYHQVSLAQDYGFVTRRAGSRKRYVKFTRMPGA